VNNPPAKLSCPPWCLNASADCQHHESEEIARIPATGQPPTYSSYGGFSARGIDLRLYHAVEENRPPSVSLRIGSETVDTEAHLQLHEAQDLLRYLEAAIGILAGTEGASR